MAHEIGNVQKEETVELKDMEAEGMACLLFLLEVVEDLLTATCCRNVNEAQSAAEASIQVKSATAVRESVKGVRVSTSSGISDQVVRLSDVASLLPCREFKVHGGQLSDSGSEISPNSICKQVDEGFKEGFNEYEVIRIVIKVTKPGNFREMLTNKDDLMVDELKRFLRTA